MRNATCVLLVLAAAGLLAVYLRPAPSAAAPIHPRQVVAAPTSAAGYAALWATLDPTVWGAADVSHLGLQLLPDGSDGTVYWIESAHRIDGAHIEVAAEPVRIGIAGSLDFHRVGTSDRVGLLEVDAAGDVTFLRWTGHAPAPHRDEHFLIPAEGAPYQREGVLFYGMRAHREAHLASGRTLMTICQNRVCPELLADGGLDYSAYRPIFVEW